MRQPTFITGFKNSQRIRVIVNDVGFYTTVIKTGDICTRDHRMAVQTALQNLAYDRAMAELKNQPMPTGFGFNYYTNFGQDDKHIPVQVDLV